MTAPYYVDESVTLHHGDCLEVLRTLPDCSVDSVVTDPPYGIRFMGQAWDGADIEKIVTRGRQTSPMPEGVGGPRGGYRSLAAEAGRYNRGLTANQAFQQWCTDWATECLRVLRPGGYLLAFGGTRTSHRLACAIEDAGFEIRDSIAWLYGSGFPKSLDVSKAIDKAAGAEREVVGIRADFAAKHAAESARGVSNARGFNEAHDPGRGGYVNPQTVGQITAPATPDAEKWQGWGTALKPAFENITVARKPLIGTVAANVLAHGTGALNIDGCRVAGDVPQVTQGLSSNPSSWEHRTERRLSQPHDAGRWPTNVVLDDSQADALDRQSGAVRSAGNYIKGSRGFDPETGRRGDAPFGVDGLTSATYNDSGGASRFFPTFHYEAKAPTSERPRIKATGSTGRVAGTPARTGRECNVCGNRTVPPGGSPWPACGHEDWSTFTTEDKSSDYVAHPTVKPLDLMRWLVRLVTPPGGTVLDPFAGSGTTAEACVIEGFRCIAIEREATYLPLIVARLSKPIAPVLDLGESA